MIAAHHRPLIGPFAVPGRSFRVRETEHGEKMKLILCLIAAIGSNWLFFEMPFVQRALIAVGACVVVCWACDHWELG